MFTFFKSIIYGFISGCAQILPIASRAHKSIMLKLFGMQQSVPFSDLMIHIGVIVALLLICGQTITKIRTASNSRANSRGVTYRTPAYFDRRLLKTALVPMLLSMLLWLTTDKLEGKLLYVAFFLALNGLILFIQDHASHGNKNASHFSALDSVLFGLCSILSFLPGISRNGAMISYGILRGADQETVVDWILILTVPALLLLCVFDLVAIISFGFGITSFLVFLYCLISGITAFAGGYLAIRLLKAISANSGFSIFSYYSWGAALFCVVLYLIS